MRYRLFDHLKENPELIFRLFEQVYGDSRAIRQRWEWEFLRNPMAESIRFFVAESGEGELVGMTVRMPCELRVGTDVFTAFFATNSMVAPGCRGQGHIHQLYQLAAQDGALHLSKGTTPSMHRQLLKMGYQEIVPSRYQTSLVAPWAWAKERLTGSRSVRRVSKKVPSAFSEFSPIERFTDEHAVLAPPSRLVTVRSADWLNWRYLNVPHRSYSVYSRTVRGRIAAWLVLRSTANNAILTELRWSPEADDEPEKSITFAKTLARSYGAIKLKTWFGHGPMRRSLSRQFFLEREETPHFSFFSHDQGWYEVPWQDAFFVHGDGDTDYL